MTNPYTTLFRQPSGDKPKKRPQIEFDLSEEASSKLANLRIEASNAKATLSNELFVLKQMAARERAAIENSMNSLVGQIVTMKQMMVDRLDQELNGLHGELEYCLAQVSDFDS